MLVYQRVANYHVSFGLQLHSLAIQRVPFEFSDQLWVLHVSSVAMRYVTNSAGDFIVVKIPPPMASQLAESWSIVEHRRTPLRGHVRSG
jgi:hypothetical protein